MKKFRFLSMILATIMIITMFTGCGKKENPSGTVDNDTNNQSTINTNNNEPAPNDTDLEVDTSNKGYITSEEAFVNKMTELLDLSLYEDLDSNEDYFEYYIKEENEKEYDLDYTWELGDGTKFTMPITFSELEEKGWILQENSDPDREMEADMMTFGTIKNASGKELSVAAYNPTEDTITFKECTVIKVDSQQYDSFEPTEKLDDAIDFTICGSLTNASTLEDIIQKLGNPTSIRLELYFDADGQYADSVINIIYTQKSSAYSELEFDLSGDGNYIISVKYDVEP